MDYQITTLLLTFIGIYFKFKYAIIYIHILVIVNEDIHVNIDNLVKHKISYCVATTAISRCNTSLVMDINIIKNIFGV